VERFTRIGTQAALVSAEADDALRTRTFDAIANSYSRQPWPSPYDSLGALRNQTTRDWEGRIDALYHELGGGDGAGGDTASLQTGGNTGGSGQKSQLAERYKRAVSRGDPTIAAVLAGEGVGAIQTIEPAEKIIMRVEAEAIKCLDQLHGAIVR
jgi:nitronate monooxygenase